MADYTLTAGQIAAHKKLIVAATVDRVFFPTGVDCEQVEVISDGVDDLYVRVDGTDPASPYGFSWRLPAGGVSVRIITVPTGGTTSVRLISPGAVTYSVTGPI